MLFRAILAAQISLFGAALGCGDNGTGAVDAAVEATDAAHAVCGAGGCWEALPPVIGGAAQEVAVVAAAGKVYVLGGFTDTGAIVDHVRVYDPTSHAWAMAAPLPMQIHHANAAVVDDIIYVLGGMQGATFTAIGNSWAYDPVLDAWRAVTSMPAGTERGGSGVGVVDGKIYVVGGVRETPVADVSVYDPIAESWTALSPLPRGLDHLEAAGVGGLLYAIGGRNGRVTSVVDTVSAYDPLTDTWTSRAPMPTARGGIGGGIIDGKIIVVGGEGSEVDPEGVFPQTERYDPASDQWASLTDMRTPRHGMGAAAIDGKLYVPAGATRHFFAATDVAEVFTP